MYSPEEANGTILIVGLLVKIQPLIFLFKFDAYVVFMFVELRNNRSNI